MPHTIKIKLADGTVKSFTFGKDKLPSELKLAVGQVSTAVLVFDSLANLMSVKKWKGVEIVTIKEAQKVSSEEVEGVKVSVQEVEEPVTKELESPVEPVESEKSKEH